MQSIIFVFLILCFSIPAFSNEKLEGKLLSVARKELMNSGWQPDKTYESCCTNTPPKGDEDPQLTSYSEAGLLYKAGYVEIVYCTGVEKDYCFFNYKKDGMCLTLQTIGEYSENGLEQKIFNQKIVKCKN